MSVPRTLTPWGPRTPKRKKKPKTYYQKLKENISTQMSIYIRLRDSDEDGYGACRTCRRVYFWKKAQAGHFISRGSGGGSGVYYDERNVHFQCVQCNAFKQGAAGEFRKFMLLEYGLPVVEELEFKDNTHRYDLRELEGLLLYYTQEAKDMRVSRFGG